MTILHVTDFHFNQHWFHWLAHDAPPHDLVVLSGDLLDLSKPATQQRQIDWVSDWIREYPAPMCICSGNHDMQWDAERERWTPAYWLRDLASSRLWVDGQRVTLDGSSILNIGCTTRPKGGPADIWVVHAPPAGTKVSIRDADYDGGDIDLILPLRRHRPLLVFSGHVHNPLNWHDDAGESLCLNPGYDGEAAFPNHILVTTESLECRYVSSRGTEILTNDVLTSFSEADPLNQPAAITVA